LFLGCFAHILAETIPLNHLNDIDYARQKSISLSRDDRRLYSEPPLSHAHSGTGRILASWITIAPRPEVRESLSPSSVFTRPSSPKNFSRRCNRNSRMKAILFRTPTRTGRNIFSVVSSCAMFVDITIWGLRPNRGNTTIIVAGPTCKKGVKPVMHRSSIKRN
jgi:hypothetical protein